MDQLRSLVERLDAEDPATAAHGRAVALWTLRIVEQLRLPRDERVLIARSAHLHDIGKLRVPGELLRAPRALSRDEFAAVAMHVLQGERLLAEYELLVYRDAVRHHHERFDGRGYPDGLRGRSIPLAARIVSVADAFDAMTSERPYRFAVSPDRALLEIDRWRGTQFDPEVVDVMLAVAGAVPRPVPV